MPELKLIVLEVLVPLQISSVDLAKLISTLKNVEGVDVVVHEVERKVELAKVTIAGDSLDYDYLKVNIENTGVSIQSVERVVYGRLDNKD